MSKNQSSCNSLFVRQSDRLLECSRRLSAVWIVVFRQSHQHEAACKSQLSGFSRSAPLK